VIRRSPLLGARLRGGLLGENLGEEGLHRLPGFLVGLGVVGGASGVVVSGSGLGEGVDGSGVGGKGEGGSGFGDLFHEAGDFSRWNEGVVGSM
jgi:hypothetical protein